MSHRLGEVIALGREVESSLGEVREPVVVFAEASGEPQAVRRRLQPVLKTFHSRLTQVHESVRVHGGVWFLV